MSEGDSYRVVIPEGEVQKRIDTWLRRHIPGPSRARWQDLIRDGHVTVNGDVRKPNHIVKPGDLVEAHIPAPRPVELEAEDIPLNILHEDDAIIVLNKPPGIVMHPAPGHAGSTLVNALLHHCQDLRGIGGELRPGIVHRLDKDTSGVLVVAKHERSLTALQQQFKSRETSKRYLALVHGRPKHDTGTIREPIGRSVHDRKKMSVVTNQGREAITHYRVLHSSGSISLLELKIETGRTHQIRVHLSHIGYPVVGDRQYGGRPERKAGIEAERHMLHAVSLSFRHPETGEPVTMEAPLPDDFRTLGRQLLGESVFDS